MTTARNAACWISKLYHDRKSTVISEIVLHKLLYFSQREALIADANAPLFMEAFEAWRFGPVMREVRVDFPAIANATDKDLQHLNGAEREAIERTLDQFADKDPWSLVALTHGESSWINARKGCDSKAPCCNEITVDAIRIDAEAMRKRRELLQDWRHRRGES